jgi:hypothetical protein
MAFDLYREGNAGEQVLPRAEAVPGLHEVFSEGKVAEPIS